MARRASSSGYRPVEVRGFGGLDFRADPQEGPLPALDLLNVDLSVPSIARSRDGVANFWSAASSTSVDAHPIFEMRNSTSSYLAFSSAGGAIYAVDQATGTTANNSGAGELGIITDGAVIGTPTSSATLYVAKGTAGTLHKYTGGAATFDSVSGTPACIFLTVQRPDNRLVAVANGSSHGHRVSFSNPNAPETWGADDFVDLTPGDGEPPMGAASWNNMVFVFKPSTIFVFTGNSVDNAGGAVFNYRTIRHGLPPLPGGGVYADRVAAGVEGVYFLARDGVYITTGGQPMKISAQLDPLFYESALATRYFSGDALDLTKLRLYYAQQKLFLVAADQVYVYAPTTRSWVLWDFGVTVGAIISASPPGSTDGREELFFTYTASSKAQLAKSGPALTTDLTAAMTSSYQTGFMDLGDGGAQKKVREWILHGSGTGFTCRTAVDDQSAFEAAAAAPSGPFGSGPVYEYRRRRASRGRNISMRIDSTSAWSLSRIIANVAGQRPESLRG